MSRLAWPVAADLQALLTTASIYDAGAGSDLDGAVAEALEVWEADTECRPFLAAADATARTFDPPGPYVQPPSFLRGGGTLLGIGAAVSVTGITADYGNGAATMVPGLQYFCEPSYPLPIRHIRFSRPLWTRPQGIVVTARWGFCDTNIPEIAWKAVLRKAALLLAPEMAKAELRAVSTEAATPWRRTSGPITEEHQRLDPVRAAAYDSLITEWQSIYDDALGVYRIWEP